MQIIMIAFRTRQGGRLTQALLSAGSTWHARPLAASVCTVVPAAAAATQVTAGRFFAPCGILLTNNTNQRQWAGVTHGALCGGALTHPASGNGAETGTADYRGYYTQKGYCV